MRDDEAEGELIDGELSRELGGEPFTEGTAAEHTGAEEDRGANQHAERMNGHRIDLDTGWRMYGIMSGVDLRVGLTVCRSTFEARARYGVGHSNGQRRRARG